MGYIEWMISTFLFLLVITFSYLFFQQKIQSMKYESFESHYFSLKLLEKIKTVENGKEFIEISKLKTLDYKELKNYIAHSFNIEINGKDIFPVILDGEVYSFSLPFLVKYENGSFGIEKVIFKFSK